LAVTSPVKVAVYEKGRCIETWEREGKCSEVLPPLLHDVLYGYRLKAIYYANGPGSFMAIKIAYVPKVLVHMRTGGVSNASLRNRLRANRMDRKAWTVNNLKPYPWTIAMKPLRKVGQWFLR